jgi:hypothetical protein
MLSGIVFILIKVIEQLDGIPKNNLDLSPILSAASVPDSGHLVTFPHQ